MATKPTKNTDWALNDITDPGSGQPNKVEPIVAKKNNGFSFLEKPPFNWINYLFNALHLWKNYLEDITDEILNDNLTISGDKTFTGKIISTNTTDSTSKDTGSIVTEGGLGVEKNINAGGTIKNNDTTDSTSKDTGSIVTEGGLGVEKNINAGGTIKNNNATESTSKDTGSIVTEGGLGVEKNINIGGTIKNNNITDSTSKDTGSIITEGGLGVEKNINAGGTIKNNNTTDSTSKDTGSIVTEGGLGVEKNINAGGSGTFGGGTKRGSDGIILKEKVIDIGDWNMDTTSSINVNHGLGSNYINIVSISCIIRNDANTINNDLFSTVNPSTGEVAGGSGDINSTYVQLVRVDGAGFDNTAYDSTSYNRGTLYISYKA